MASLHETNNNSWRVIYDLPDGAKRNQKQKTFRNKKEAEKFLKEVEYKQSINELKDYKTISVKDFFKEWLEIYGQKNWTPQTYTASKTNVEIHILPEFGNKKLTDITTLMVDKFIQKLYKKKASGLKYARVKIEDRPYLTSTAVRSVYMTLNSALNQAVEWDMLSVNPVKTKPPSKSKAKGRTIWSGKQVLYAINHMKEEPILRLALHCAFQCSLRPGEVVGLTWDSIDFEKGTITINKALQRADKEAIEKSKRESILRIFPCKTEDAKSSIILKSTKNTSSERTNFLTKPLIEELLERKNQVEKDKEYFCSEYNDYNLVFSLEYGDPIETHLIEKWFMKWQNKSFANLPLMTFQSVRHSSATFKESIAEGRIKAIQDDLGHASSHQTVNTYMKTTQTAKVALKDVFEEKFYNQGKSKEVFKTKNGEINMNALNEALELLKQKDTQTYMSVLNAITTNNT